VNLRRSESLHFFDATLDVLQAHTLPLADVSFFYPPGDMIESCGSKIS
jgi:hypothetical protein